MLLSSQSTTLDWMLDQHGLVHGGMKTMSSAPLHVPVAMLLNLQLAACYTCAHNIMYSGAASTPSEAEDVCKVLHRAGVVLRHEDLVRHVRSATYTA